MIKEYGSYVMQKLEKLIQTQEDAIKKSADLIYEANKNGRSFFIIGSGHSHILAEELYARAGGYANIKPILEPELFLHQHPLKSTYIERLEGYADVIIRLHRIQRDDVVLIASNSGRNNLPVEMGLKCRDIGAKVIAITSIEHSSKVSSRHSSGLRLMDIAQVVIDNCGDFGDAGFRIGDSGIYSGATSTILGGFIAQAIIVELINLYVENKEEPPVFKSSNMDNTDEYNERLMEKYIL